MSGSPEIPQLGAPAPEGEALTRVLGTIIALADDLHLTLPALGIGPDSRLDTEVGFDSLTLLELRDRLEAEFRTTIPDEVFADAVTPRHWSHAILAIGHEPRTAPTIPEPVPAMLERRDERLGSSGNDTLLGAFATRARSRPDQVHLRLLHFPESLSPPRDFTYGELWSAASSTADRLAARGLRRGDTVALMLPTSPEYFVIFLGTMLASGTPVPLYPPARPGELEEHLRRQVAILTNAQARLLVVPPVAHLVARALRAAVPSLKAIISAGELVSGPAHPRVAFDIGRADIGLIQYTSGSTGDPKGVILTHGDLVANIVAMGEAAKVGDDDVFVSWLPLYHDMGLIAAWLTGLYYGFRVVVMAPTVFLARPERWLRAIGTEQGTLSAAPNVAYELCAGLRDDQIAGIDLSSWRLAFNGSESVRPATIARFCERFGPYGFARTAMTPAYGLAEAGVGVTFSPPGRGPLTQRVARDDLVGSGRARAVPDGDPDALEFVSCGRPIPGYEVRIVGEDDEVLPEQREGRVEFVGPSATRGYYRNEAATARLLHGRWLDTGDLGYLADGELFLTGRSKDLIIRSGQNLHPDELEEAIGALPGVRQGHVAAFSSVDPSLGTERLIVMAETAVTAETERSELRASIVTTAVREIGAPPDDVVLVEPGVVMLTASGKLARSACRDRYERGDLSRHHTPPWLQLLRVVRSGLRPALRQRLRDLLDFGYGIYALGVALVVAALCWPFVVYLPAPSRWRFFAVRCAGTTIRRMVGVPLTVVGKTPDQRPLVVVANHASFVDGLVVILVFGEPVTFLVGDVFSKQRFIGHFLARLGCVFVKTGTPSDATVLTARLAEALRSGKSVASFPEGGLAPTTGIRDFHLGAFRVALDAGVQVLPIGISGTRSIVPPGRRLPRRGAVRVEIGTPIVPIGVDWPAVATLRDAARDAVAAQSDEPVVHA